MVVIEIQYADLLLGKSVLTLDQEYNVMAQLFTRIKALEEEDPDSMYSDVTQLYGFPQIPGFNGIVLLLGVPDPDVVIARAKRLIVDGKQEQLLKLMVYAAKNEREFAAEAREIGVRIGRRTDEDFHTLTLTYADLVAGGSVLGVRDEAYLIGLLYVKMANLVESGDAVGGRPVYCFLPSFLWENRPRPIAITAVPDIETVKCAALGLMRDGKINLNKIKSSQ